MLSDLEVAQNLAADLQVANQILEAKITRMEEPYGAATGQVGSWLVYGLRHNLMRLPRGAGCARGASPCGIGP